VKQPGDTEEDAPGWDAIGRALELMFGPHEAAHWEGSASLSGQDGIWGLSAYRADEFWFYVTFGLSELWGKVSDDPNLSGWGLELTMRIPVTGVEPPLWPATLLGQLGTYVFSTGNVFDPGHRFDARAELTGGTPATHLTAIAFAEDPQLGIIDTPNGSVTFVTAFGITRDELDRMKASRTSAVMDEFRTTNNLLITDPARTESRS
jgi:suppressor of fused-like protein